MCSHGTCWHTGTLSGGYGRAVRAAKPMVCMEVSDMLYPVLSNLIHIAHESRWVSSW